MPIRRQERSHQSCSGATRATFRIRRFCPCLLRPICHRLARYRVLSSIPESSKVDPDLVMRKSWRFSPDKNFAPSAQGAARPLRLQRLKCRRAPKATVAQLFAVVRLLADVPWLLAAEAVDKFVDCLLKFFRVFSTDIIVPAIRQEH